MKSLLALALALALLAPSHAFPTLHPRDNSSHSCVARTYIFSFHDHYDFSGPYNCSALWENLEMRVVAVSKPHCAPGPAEGTSKAWFNTPMGMGSQTKDAMEASMCMVRGGKRTCRVNTGYEGAEEGRRHVDCDWSHGP